MDHADEPLVPMTNSSAGSASSTTSAVSPFVQEVPAWKLFVRVARHGAADVDHLAAVEHEPVAPQGVEPIGELLNLQQAGSVLHQCTDPDQCHHDRGAGQQSDCS